MQANNDRQQIAEVAPATIMGDGNETTTESEERTHQQADWEWELNSV